MKFLINKFFKNNLKICIVGLGYVGLPVAVSFSKKYSVTGFDIDKLRIKNLQKGIDINNSIRKDKLKYLKKINFTNNIKNLNKVDIFIIAIPTPILKDKKPNLKLIYKALDIFKKIDIKNKLVIIESTVYPEA